MQANLLDPSGGLVYVTLILFPNEKIFVSGAG